MMDDLKNLEVNSLSNAELIELHDVVSKHLEYLEASIINESSEEGETNDGQ